MRRERFFHLIARKNSGLAVFFARIWAEKPASQQRTCSASCTATPPARQATSAGFYHDAYARDHFHTTAIPIPNVIEIGQLDAQHAFCITEKLPGFTLQDADTQTITRLLKPVADAWQAIRAIDISHTTGFGDLDLNGQGEYPTWRAFLLAILDPARYQWKPILQHMESGLFGRLTTAFTALVDACPEERRLIHGDFGSNNVLTDGQRVTAILDWDNAKYGDPLFDVATAYFWRPWLPCMDLQAAYYEPSLPPSPTVTSASSATNCAYGYTKSTRMCVMEVRRQPHGSSSAVQSCCAEWPYSTSGKGGGRKGTGED